MFDLAATYAQFTVAVQLIRSQIGLNERQIPSPPHSVSITQYLQLQFYVPCLGGDVSIRLNFLHWLSEFSGVVLSFCTLSR